MNTWAARSQRRAGDKQNSVKRSPQTKEWSVQRNKALMSCPHTATLHSKNMARTGLRCAILKNHQLNPIFLHRTFQKERYGLHLLFDVMSSQPGTHDRRHQQMKHLRPTPLSLSLIVWSGDRMAQATLLQCEMPVAMASEFGTTTFCIILAGVSTCRYCKPKSFLAQSHLSS